MPGGQKGAECAPGMLDCVEVGVMPFDEGAWECGHVELRLEALGKGW